MTYCKGWCKNKNPQIWGKKCLMWGGGIFGLEFENNIVVWNQPPQKCPTSKFRKRVKALKFGNINALTGYFCTRVLKSYCHIWNQPPRIFLIWVLTHTVNFGIGLVFSEGQRFAFSECPDPGLGPKTPFLVYFWAGVPASSDLPNSKMS